MKRWYLLCLGLGLLYLAFPTQNSTLDAWAYAGDIRHQQDLFHPHHLLYSATGALFYGEERMEIDILAWQKRLNALVALSCLMVLGFMLQDREKDEKEILAYLLIVGSSFGIMRFATENEVYLWPIFYSLLGTWAYIRYLRESMLKWVLWGGLAMAVACLYHQIHAIWWIGLAAGFGRKQIRHIWAYLLPACLVPIAYVLVVSQVLGKPLTIEHLQAFILRDFYKGSAQVLPSFKTALLTPINLFRTFVQVHGIVFSMLLKHFWAWIPLVISLGAGIIFMRKKPLQSTSIAAFRDPFAATIFFILMGHIGLAIWAAGNAEFMVMVPFLMALWISARWTIPYSTIQWLGIAFLVWNVCFGIFPLWNWDYYRDGDMVNFVRKNPDAYYILTERNIINNQIYYQTGQDWNHRMTSAYKADSVFIDSLLQSGYQVYSNAIDQPQLFSRASLTGETPDQLGRFQVFRPQAVDSISGYTGKYHIWRLFSPNP